MAHHEGDPGTRGPGRPRAHPNPAARQRAYRQRVAARLAAAARGQTSEAHSSIPAHPADDGKPKTGKELLDALIASGFIGAWKDRADIGDSSEFARRLRERVQTREWD